MALGFLDLGRDTFLTEGTGAVTLDNSPPSTYVLPPAGVSPTELAEGIETDYLMWTADRATWEAGRGTRGAANTLTRDTVYQSSNADAAVTFPAGTKYLHIGPSAIWFNKIEAMSAAANLSLNLITTLGTISGMLHVVDDTDSASVEVLRLSGLRATPTAGDAITLPFYLANSAGDAAQFAGIKAGAETTTSNAKDGSLAFQVMVNDTLRDAISMQSPALGAAASIGIAIGWAGLSAGSSESGGPYTSGFTTSETGESTFNMVRSVSTNALMGAGVDGDTYRRFLIDATGALNWGSGAAERDTNIYRSAADTLKTDDAFSVGLDLTVGNDLTIEGAASRIVFTGTNGGGGEGVLYTDSTNNVRYALHFPGSDVVVFSNRAPNAIVEIRASNATGGGGANEITVLSCVFDGATFNTKLFIDGSSDQTQLSVQGHSTQTSDLFVVEESDGTDLFSVSEANTSVTNSGGLVLIQTNQADQTSKNGHLAVEHFLNAEEDTLGFQVFSLGTGSSPTISGIDFGGGSGSYNAVSTISFYVAADSVTPSGTKHLQITNGLITVSDAVDLVFNATTGTKIGTATTQKIAFYNNTPIVQPIALTAALNQITHTEPGTPDYAIQDMTNSSPFGFVTQDEANSLLKVVKNLQVRVDELETKLQSLGLVA